MNYIGSNSLRNIVETSDAPYSKNTPYAISAGDTFSGNISYSGDKDAVAIRLIRGASYTFELTGRGSGHGTLFDPYLELFDYSPSLLKSDDDGGERLFESRISFTASNTGTYFLAAKSAPWLSSSTGSYRLTTTVNSTPEIVSTVRDFGDFAPNADLSLSDIWSGIDHTNVFMQGLKWGNGCKWGSANPTTTTTALKFFIYDDDITMGQFKAGPLLAQERTGYISAMNAFSSVANITFSEGRTASESHILWASLNKEESIGAAGWASPPDTTGSYLYASTTPTGLTTVNYTEYSTDGVPDRSDIFSPGTFLLELAMHELGHSMGIAHPHDNTAVFPGVLNSNDTGDHGLSASPYTVMSYNTVGSNDYNPSSYSASSGFLETLGAFDIAATQALYGANTNASTGNNTYSLDNSNLNGWNCLWDNGGEDTITAAGQTDSVTIDLRNATLENSLGGGGFISRLGTQNIGYTIAFNSTGNCIIENATGGSNNDSLVGNEYNNLLNGGAGDDTLIGGAGNDTYLVDSTSDTVTENSSEGTDLIQSSVTYTASNNVENLTLTGSSNIDATGNSLDNTLTGNSGNNTLDGGSGNDTLIGGSGDDTLTGGTGTDTAQFSADIYNYTVWKSADNQTIKITDNTSNRDGTDSLTTIENLTFNSTTYTASNLRNGAFLSSDGYKLIGTSDIYTLKNSEGGTYSDDSSSLWDVTAAKQTGSGFDVLFEGSDGSYREGYNYIWSTNSSGVMTTGSGWLTDAQTASHASGYENKFGKDFNNDGLISGGSAYQLFGSSDIYTLKNSEGGTYSDDSSSLWDVTAAKQTGSGFDVLFEGSDGSYREGYNYIWSTNSSGVMTTGSGWLTDAQTASHASGYENKFGKDFNNDGLISGGSAYQLFGSSDIYTLKNSEGGTYSDDSSSLWDVTAAKQTGSGFDVLFEGSDGSYREGYNYIWSTNSSGVMTTGSGWLTDAQTTSNGYESIFNIDFNKNGIID
ncbi:MULTISPECIES: M10 family metallopeptidase C-terminal domain-containing protein [unclassified Prochlorococcus]|uniref:M10 family metallopeptidase C-terminal domain-containing protein n=2 Tax=Prochlorococcus TaxID=1218 RepID=UPI0018DDE7AE|nr:MULTISPECIES: M10 family metallopeptidase C-terminal domain-containing protein [unclassified Prochlorococcus]